MMYATCQSRATREVYQPMRLADNFADASLSVFLLLQHQLLLQQQHTHQHAYNSWQGEIYCPAVSHVSLIQAIITNCYAPGWAQGSLT